MGDTSIDYNKKLTGLPGLSSSERKIWIEANKHRFPGIEQLRSADQDYIYNRVYKDDQYIQEFGIDAFKANTDPSSRDKEFETYILNNAIQSKYSGDSNLDKMKNLTNDGLKELLESNYRSPEEIEKYKKQGSSTNINQGFMPASRMISNVKNYDKQTPEYWGNVLEEGNNELLQSIYNKDLQRKAVDTSVEAAAYSDNFYRGLESGEISHEYIDKLFDELTQGTEYTLRKYSKEFADFNQTDKIRYLSKMMGLMNKYGEEDAINLLGTDLQNYASEHMTGGQKVNNLRREFYTSVVSEALNEVIALKNVWNAAFDKEELKANLQGLTKEGEILPNWLNPQYVQGMKQYNTTSADEIDKIRQSGGHTPYANITKAGDEYDIFNLTNIGNSLVEGIGQATTMATQALIFKGLGTGVGAALGKTGKAASFASKAIAVAEIGLPALGGAHAESYESYQNTLQEATEKIDSYIDSAASETLNNHLNSGAFIADFTSYVERRKALDKEQGKVWLDEKTFNEQAYQDYIRGKYNTYVSNLKDSEQIERLKEEAKNSAVSAYNTALAVSTFKNAGANAMLRKVFLSKGTREQIDDLFNPKAPKTAINADGTLKAGTYNFYQKHIKPITKNFFGEGADEWLDVVINNGAQNFGIADFNDYMTKEIDSENYIESIDNGLFHLMKGFSELPEDIFTKEALFEAGMGAFSGVLRFTPNVGFVFDKNQRGQSFKTDSEGNKISFIESLSKLIDNQAISDAAEIRKSQREYESAINTANKTLETHKKDLEAIGKTISTLSDFDNPGESTREVADNKFNNIIKAAFMLRDLESGEYTSMSTSVSNAIANIDKMANGELSEEETESLITEFLANPSNKSIASKPNAREIAAQKLQDNAKEFKKIRATIESEYAKLNENKETRNLSDYAKKQIIFTSLLSDNIDKRLSLLGEELGVAISQDSGINISSHFGSKEAFWRERKNLFKAEEETKAKIESLEETIFKSNEKLITATKEERPIIEAVINATIGALKQSQATLQRIQADKNAFKNYESFFEGNEEVPILSEQQIMTLPPQQRARMLNPKFYGDYSIEQRIIIDKVKNSLINKDIKALEKIEDMAILADKRDAIIESRSNMLRNPEFLSSYMAVAEKYRQKRLEDSAYKKAVQSVLDKLEPLSDEELIIQTKVESPEAIQVYLEAHPEKSELLKNNLELSKFNRDKSKIIFNMYNNKSQRGALSRAVSPFISSANTVEEAMSNLESALESKNIDPLLKKEVEKLLKSLEQLNYQRDATKIQSREEKKTQKEAEDKRKEEERIKQEEIKRKEEELKKQAEEKAKSEENPIPNRDDYTAETSGDEISIDGETFTETVEIPSEVTEKTTIADNHNPNNTITIDEEISRDKDAVIITPTVEYIETTDSNPLTYKGNISDWEYESLKLEGKQKRWEGNKEGDSRHQVLEWLDAMGIHFQDIIDHELTRIMNTGANIQFMMVSNQFDVTGDKIVQDYLFEVVEYNDKVRKIHPEDKGSIITANDKQWLVIGIANFDAKNDLQRKSFGNMQYEIKKQRHKHISENPGERFFVSDTYKTKVSHIHKGFITKALQREDVSNRTIGELLQGDRNPRNLDIEDLKWIVVLNNGAIHPVGISDPSKISFSSNLQSKEGEVFLMIEAADGKYIPIYMQPVSYKNMREGTLKSRIDNLINELSAPKLEDRLEAKKQLKQLLVMNDKNNIEIDENSGVISIKEEGHIIKTFNIEDPSFNRLELVDTVQSLDLRVNIDKDLLSNPRRLKEYDEAGVLVTDIAKLGTSGATYSIYSMDDKGNPMIPKEPSERTTNESGNIQHTITHAGMDYVEVNGEFFKDNQRITDPITLEQLRLLQQIEGLNPVETTGKYKYYILSNDKNNPIVVAVDSNKVVTKASKQQALAKIKEIQDKAIAEKQKEALKQAEIKEETPQNAYDTIVNPKQEVEEKIQEEVKSDVNTISNESIIQETKDTFNIEDIYSDDIYGDELDSIIEDKLESGVWEDPEGLLNTTEGVKKYLENKGISTIGIKDMKIWCDMVRKCK